MQHGTKTTLLFLTAVEEVSWLLLPSVVSLPGIEITDFQMPDKMSDSIKHLPDILKIHQTSCQLV